MTSDMKDNELKIIRRFNAPVNMVWEAWTDTDQVVQWWGPRGFTLTSHSKDLRPGGIWHYTMHGPDGTDYPNKTLYHEVIRETKLVYDHGGYDDRPPLFRVTALFTEIDGQTQLDLTMTLASAEAAVEIRKFIKKAGGEATWDRLAEYLEKIKSGQEVFVINRTFDVARDLMFKIWTDPAIIEKWLPPVGFDMQFIRADIREGGESFYVMSGQSGMKMYGKMKYVSIQNPEKIIYTQQFCDEEGAVCRHPAAPTWPETMHTIIQFSEEGTHKTRITVLWSVIGNVSHEEMQTFIQGRAGMTMGWTGSFDKLDRYLEKGSA